MSRYINFPFMNWSALPSLPVGLAFIFLSFYSNAQPFIVDKVIGVVGDKIVLHSDIQEQMAYIASQQNTLPDGIECMIMDQLLTQQLLLDQANKDSIVVQESEVTQQVDSRINHILSLMRGDEEQFQAYYGMTVSEVRDQFKEDMQDQLLTQRMQTTVVENVNVTPSEVKAYFKKIPVDSLPYFNSEVQIGELVVKPKVNKEQLEIARQKVEEIRKRIVENNENFVELAKQYSDDEGSRAQGGDLGWVRRGELVPAFEAAVFRLSKNEISKPVKTIFGYHVIQLLERRGNAVNARHILIRPSLTEADKVVAIEKLDTIRNLILTDSLSFIEAVKKFSEDDQSKNNAGLMMNPATGVNIFEIGDLPPEVYFAIDTMEVGGVSGYVEFDDFSGDPTYKLLKLISRTEPHLANLKDDYAKIQRAALEEKKMEFLSKWIQMKSEETHIYVDEGLKGCPSLGKWIKP